MRKRFHGIPTGAALLVTLGATTLSVSTAYADDFNPANAPKLTLQQAQQIVESTFHIGSDYALQNESFNSSPGASDPQTYAFSYAPTNPALSGVWIGITVDANTGRIINFNQPTQDNHFAFPVPKSADEAKSIALEWAKKLYPDQSSGVKILPLQSTFGSLLGPVSYTYNFERMVGGIPAPFDGFSITIDQDGQLTSVMDHWSDLQFPNASLAMSKEKASDLYSKSIDLHLVYRPVWNKDSKSTTELLYTQTNSSSYWATMFGDQSTIASPVFNALTGDLIDSTGAVQQPGTYQVPQPLVVGGPTLPAKLQAVNWNESQTLTYAKDVLGLTDQDKLISANEIQAPNDIVTWNFVWQTSGNQQISASFNATYGVLTNYGKYRVGPIQANGASTQGSVHLTQEDLNQRVYQFVKKAFPNATGSMAVIETPVTNPPSGLQTSFQIVTLVNGVANEANQGNINVDPTTGDIQEVWFNVGQTQDEVLPSKQSAISIDEAKQKWIQNRPLTLEYLMTQSSGDGVPYNGKAPSAGGHTSQVMLAYASSSHDGTDSFNAVTGEFDGPMNPAPYSGKLNDLDGNPAASQIQLLVNRELIPVDSNGNVHPNQELTNGAFVKLAVDALGQQYRYNPKMAMDAAASTVLSSVPQGSPVYPEVAVAYQLGWLPNGQPFKPDDSLTRGYAAQILARALGYGALLSHPEAFQSPAKDADSISKAEFAADAAMSSMGIFPLIDGNFNSSGHVTLGDAAIAIVQTANIWNNTDKKYNASSTMK